MTNASIEVDPQQEFEEELIESEELQALLDARAKAKATLAPLQATYKAADTAAKDAVKKLELEEGVAYRCGPHRFKLVTSEAGEVSFERAAGLRISIGKLKPKKQRKR